MTSADGGLGVLCSGEEQAPDNVACCAPHAHREPRACVGLSPGPACLHTAGPSTASVRNLLLQVDSHAGLPVAGRVTHGRRTPWAHASGLASRQL